MAVRALGRDAGFALLEPLMAMAIAVIGFLGIYATSLQAGKMVSAAEEEALVTAGLEERIEQLRLLEWGELTDGTGLTTKVWVARPAVLAGLTVGGETLTLSPCDAPGAGTLQGAWLDGAGPTAAMTPGTALSAASAVKAVATLTWKGRRSQRTQTRSLITVISQGGISRSDRP